MLFKKIIAYILVVILLLSYFYGNSYFHEFLFKFNIVVLFLSFFFVKESFQFRLSYLKSIIFLFFTYNLISLFFTPDLFSLDKFLKVIRYIMYLIAFIIMINFSMPVFKKECISLSRLVYLPVLGSFISIIYFLYHGELRLMNCFNPSYPIHDGVKFGLLIIFLLFLFNKTTSKKEFFLILISISIISYAVFLTYSRTAILAVVLTILSTCFFKFRSKGLLPIFSLIFATLLFIITPENISSNNVTSYKVNNLAKEIIETQHSDISFNEISSLVERSDAGRFSLWKTIYKSMSGNEHIFGKGFLANHSFNESHGICAIHPHSAFMFSYFHGGTILLLLHILILLEVFKISLKKIKNSNSFLLFLFIIYSFIPQFTNGESIFIIAKGFSECEIIFWIPVSLGLYYEYKS